MNNNLKTWKWYFQVKFCCRCFDECEPKKWKGVVCKVDDNNNIKQIFDVATKSFNHTQRQQNSFAMKQKF